MTIIDKIADSYRASLAEVPYGDSTLISLPSAFTTGTLLTVLVTTGADVAQVTDRGLTADVLADYGVDLTARRAAESFAAVRKSVDLPPAFGAEDWEISATVDFADVAVAIQAVTDAAMRADGLKVLAAGAKPARFSEKSTQQVGCRTAVTPRAKMLGRHGSSRTVTLSYPGQDHQPYFLQALSAGDNETRTRHYDHTSSVFFRAVPDRSHRVALLQDGDWDDWQVSGLKDVCEVIREGDLNDFLTSTAELITSV